MGLRKILTDKDPALHKVCKPVTSFDAKLHKLLDDMAETMQEANGVGLAAPQITYIMQALKQKGLSVDTDITTIDEAKNAILSAIRSK